MATVLGCFDMLIWHMQLARSGRVPTDWHDGIVAGVSFRLSRMSFHRNCLVAAGVIIRGYRQTASRRILSLRLSSL